MQSSVDGRDLSPKHTWWYKFFMAVPVRCFLLPIGGRYLRIKTDRYKGKLPDRPFIMVFNHATDYDFIGTIKAIKPYGRFVMSDELIKKPWKRRVIMFATNGIYRRKGENANNVVEAIKQTLDQGINVFMAPEGQVTMNGVTAPIRGRTGRLIKELGVDLVTIRMQGGYLIKPKWAGSKSKKGPLFGGVVAVHSSEELSEMTPEQINDLIAHDLEFNFFEWQKENHIPYDRENRAEHMEKILYRCPKCESMYKLHSEGDDLFCTECGYRVNVDVYGLFQGEEVVFDNLYDWDVWQKEWLRSQRPVWEANPDEIITSDTDCTLIRMHDNETEWMSKEDVTLSITFNEVIIESPNVSMRMPLKDLEGLASVRGGMSVSYRGEYYKVLCLKYYSPMLRYRTIRRIIMNEKDI